MIAILSEFFGLAAQLSGLLLIVTINLSAARTLLTKSIRKDPILSKSSFAFLAVFILAILLHAVIR